MTSQISGLDTRFALAQAIAKEAGAVALDYYNRRETLVIETKRDPQDVVSIADREVENLIRARVAEAHANDGFLGEEYGLARGSPAIPGWSIRSTAPARSSTACRTGVSRSPFCTTTNR